MKCSESLKLTWKKTIWFKWIHLNYIYFTAMLIQWVNTVRKYYVMNGYRCSTVTANITVYWCIKYCLFIKNIVVFPVLINDLNLIFFFRTQDKKTAFSLIGHWTDYLSFSVSMIELAIFISWCDVTVFDSIFNQFSKKCMSNALCSCRQYFYDEFMQYIIGNDVNRLYKKGIKISRDHKNSNRFFFYYFFFAKINSFLKSV